MARVWLFGEDVDTDQIVPGRYAPYMTSEEELPKHAFIEARPEFAREVRPGDIIVAGANFGCGSSREYAPKALKLCGVGAIIAPGFARIFFRNALNLGIPLFETDLTGVLRDGQEVTLDMERYVVVTDAGQEYPLKPPPDFVREIWEAGSTVAYFRRYGRLPGQRAREQGGE
ncbi:MAG: 3-isopropylmalate dehydratase small subunit [Anaerolineae bacterium]|nr:3-isopropylmalate dehydratase small subunit [Anaerolineae bacterium]